VSIVQNHCVRILVVVALLLCSACVPVSIPFNLYPINSTDSSLPILCRLRLHFGWQTMTITATLPNSGEFSGSSPTNPTPPNREFAPYWDQVFGPGYFNAKVLGSKNHIRTTLKNEQGDELQLEMHAIPGDPHGALEGVAIDSKKNIYKAGF
jgi:hypothetical protein